MHSKKLPSFRYSSFLIWNISTASKSTFCPLALAQVPLPHDCLWPTWKANLMSFYPWPTGLNGYLWSKYQLVALCDPALTIPTYFIACWFHSFCFSNTELFYVFSFSGHTVWWVCNFAYNDLLYITLTHPSKIISGSISPGSPPWFIRLG